MPIYTGKSADGSDMEELYGGAYMNPDNENEWSISPYPSQRKAMRIKNSAKEYMNGRYTLNDVYKQIKAKTCKLPFRLREYVLSHYNDKGEFIAGDE
jgi:hypothetical protein